MKQNDDEYGLLVSFEDQSPEYVHGFEAGQIWEEMARCKDINKTVHTANKVTLERMAIAAGYVVEFEKTEFKEWVFMKGHKAKARPEGGNPNGLRIVK